MDERDFGHRHPMDPVDLEGEEARRAVLGTLWDTAPDAIMIIAEDGTLRDFSPAGQTIFGYHHDEIIGRAVAVILPDWVAWVDEVSRAGTVQVEARGRKQDGAALPVALTLGRTVANGAEVIVCFARDRRRQVEMARQLEMAQAELQQLMRLSTVTMMAGALAHDVNQPLTSAATYVQAADLMLAKDGVAEDAPARNALSKGLGEIRRAADIIRQIRTFVDRREPDRRLSDINQLVREASKVVGLGLTSERVALELDLAPDLPPIEVDPVQIQQVLFNLMRNAVEAMAGTPRPTLTIRTGREGDTVFATVSDIGGGIDLQVRDRLFQPFQTTKEEGLGLGLAICRAILGAHGGSLAGESGPNGGAVFTLRLPVEERR
ncbi:MAG: ATP-binding protein [Pseudomonadota bacterium]